MNETKTTLALFGTFLLAGVAIGLLLFAPVTTPINIISPPSETIQVAPEPTPAPVYRDPDLYVNATTVLDLVDVLADIHKEAKAAKAELEAVKVEAQQIIRAMLQEIQRLNSKPTVDPTDTYNVDLH